MTIDDRTVDGAGDRAPLSVALISPAWPPNAYANGIIPYVANIAEEMRAAGHSV